MSRREIVVRRQARELTLQGIYQWLLHDAQDDAPAHAQLLAIEELLDSAVPETKEKDEQAAAETGFPTALLQGVISEAEGLRTLFAPLLTRTVAELSPVEHAILLLGAYELRHNVETPYRVVINEAVELAKKYGGTDGHKFVNGVLDRLAAQTRPEEVAAVRAQAAGKKNQRG